MHAEQALLNDTKLIGAWKRGAFDWHSALHSKGADVNQHVGALSHTALPIAPGSCTGIRFRNTPKIQGQVEQEF